MSVIIPYRPQYRFCVYEHKIQRDRELSVNRMIVIKNADNLIVRFTGLEYFSFHFTGQAPKIKVSSKSELVYICKALNDILLHEKVNRIADITQEMIYNCFDRLSAEPKRNCDESYRSQQSLDLSVRTVTNFFANLSLYYQTAVRHDQILREIYSKRNRETRRVERMYIPAYVPSRHHSHDVELLRDLPFAAAERLIQLAEVHDPMIAFALAAQLTAGLRPSEVMNLRQNESPLSNVPCICISEIGTTVNAIEIDLTREFVLRSDGVSVGKIKKERVVDIFDRFIPEFYVAYRRHLLLLEHTPFEMDHRPMFIGRNGKAMTYSTYVRRVSRLVNTFLKPELKESPDPILSAYGHKLDSYNFTLHSLRHCFTVRLAMEGLDVAQIMHFRGDRSPESALTYVANKGELIQKLVTYHDSVLDDLSKEGSNVYFQS